MPYDDPGIAVRDAVGEQLAVSVTVGELAGKTEPHDRPGRRPRSSKALRLGPEMVLQRRGGERMVVGRYLAPRPDDEDAPRGGIFRRLARELGLLIVVGGVIVLLFVGYQLIGTNVTERHDQTRLRNEFNHALAAHAAAATTTLPASTVPTTVPSATPTTPTVPAAATAPTTPGTPTTVAPPTTAPVATTTPASPTTDNPLVGGASSGTAVAAGRALDHLVIPAINVDKYVVQGVSESDLMEGPGHYPQTVLPGQVGNAAIAGHRTTYGAPFFKLNNLKSGDRIIITDTSDHRFTYRVKSVEVVAPSDVSVLNPTKTAQLTLTTCNPRFSLTSRLVVVATLSVPKTSPKAGTPASSAGSATTVPTTTPTTPTTLTPTTVTPTTAAPVPSGNLASATLGAGDDAARRPAIFYGALVAFLWLLTRVAVARTRRWKRNLAYLIGVAACLVALWFLFENVVRLLPANL